MVDGYRDEGWAEDFDLWLRLFEAGICFTKVERYLYFWREHAERLTRVDGRYSVENFLRCKAKFLLAGPLKGRKRVVIWGAGQLPEAGGRASARICGIRRKRGGVKRWSSASNRQFGCHRRVARGVLYALVR